MQLELQFDDKFVNAEFPQATRGEYIKGLIKGISPRNIILSFNDFVHRKSCFQLLYNIDLYDASGKKIRSTGFKESHSFVRNFLKMLGEKTMGITYGYNQSWKNGMYDTSNVEVEWVTTNQGGIIPNETASGWGIASEAGQGSYGIVVGLGTNAVTNTDYKLQTPILNHGSGGTQLLFGQTKGTATEIMGANVDYIIHRIITNNSGSTITLKEMGIYMLCYAGSAPSYPTTYYVCILRDNVDFAIASGEACIITYKWRTTV